MKFYTAFGGEVAEVASLTEPGTAPEESWKATRAAAGSPITTCCSHAMAL